MHESFSSDIQQIQSEPLSSNKPFLYRLHKGVVCLGSNGDAVPKTYRTDKNLNLRFYKCEDCKTFNWADQITSPATQQNIYSTNNFNSEIKKSSYRLNDVEKEVSSMKCDNALTTVKESYDTDNFYSNRYECYAANDVGFSHSSGYNRSTSGMNDWRKQSSSKLYDNVLSERTFLTDQENYSSDKKKSDGYQSYAANDGEFYHSSGCTSSTSGVNDWRK